MTCSPDDLESTSGLSADCAGLVLTAPLERCAARCERAEGETVERPKPPTTAREFEHALYYALGFSRRQAKKIARNGFRPTVPDDDADDLEMLAAALRIRGAAMKGSS